MDFTTELEQLLNKYSKESGSNTPDFILAEYISACLNTFEKTVSKRDKWHGKNKQKSSKNTKEVDPPKKEPLKDNAPLPAPVGQKPTTGYGNPFGGTSWGA